MFRLNSSFATLPVGALLPLLCSVSALISAQPAAAAAEAGPLPKLAGVWDMDHKNYKSSTRFSAKERIGIDVDGKAPPLQPWAQQLLDKRVNDADQNDKIFANNAAKCLPQGIPYMLFAAVDGPIQILENGDQITILSTEMNEQWLVYVGGQHKKSPDPSYHGDSVAHWEGDTLIIDTIGIGADKTTIDQVGTPHSDDLHVVTRIHRTGPDDLEVRILLDDPKAFLRPWERSVMYHRAKPGARIDEYVCENTANGPDASGFQGFRAP